MVYVCVIGIARGIQPLSYLVNQFNDGAGGSSQTTYTAVRESIVSIETSGSILKSITFECFFQCSVETIPEVPVKTQDMYSAYTSDTTRMHVPIQNSLFMLSCVPGSSIYYVRHSIALFGGHILQCV